MPDAVDRLTCRSCGKTAPDEACYCSQCGQPLMLSGQRPESPKPRWYYNVWFVLFMLFFVVGPLGLPLVWKNPHFSRWVKILLTLVMVLYTVVLIDVTIRAFKLAMEQINRLDSTFQF